MGLLKTQHSRRHERDQREPGPPPTTTAAGAAGTAAAAIPSPPPRSPDHSVRPGLTLPGYHYRGVLCVPAAATTALDAFALMDAEGTSALVGAHGGPLGRRPGVSDLVHYLIRSFIRSFVH